MLNIDKDKLNYYYNVGNYNSFFKEAEKITDFLLTRNYKILDKEKKEDITQECMLNLWKKIKQGKVDGSKNLMSFVWQNSSYRILEIFRKENNRNKIARMVSYEDYIVNNEDIIA